MYSETDLMNEARAIRDKWRGQGRELVKAWMVHELMAAHPFPENADPMHVLCVNIKTGDTFRRVINEDKVDADDGQTTFEGWEHLQRSYLIDREGRQVDVPTEQMTNVELLAKADFFRKLSAANAAHALEIERYVGIRRATDSIPAA